jgi:hypothetical protein
MKYSQKTLTPIVYGEKYYWNAAKMKSILEGIRDRMNSYDLISIANWREKISSCKAVKSY